MSGERPDPDRGVFETLLLRDGRLHALGEHLSRLERSLRDLYGSPLPPATRAHLLGRLAAAASRASGERRVRVDVVPGSGGELGVTIVVSDPPSRRGVVLEPVVVPGGLGPHKWRDRRLVDRPAGQPVPLILDADDSVLEAAWANVWVLDGDALTTPPADGRVLPGVTRGRLLELAPALGLTAREAPLSLAQVRAAPILFLTSALRLAVPAGLGRRPPPSPPVDRIRDALGE